MSALRCVSMPCSKPDWSNGGVRGLRERYHLRDDLPAMRCVGYRRSGKCCRDACRWRNCTNAASTPHASSPKRQLTWLRHMPDLNHVDGLADDLMDRLRRLVTTALEGTDKHITDRP